MGLLPEGEANHARLLGIVQKSQVTIVMVWGCNQVILVDLMLLKLFSFVVVKFLMILLLVLRFFAGDFAKDVGVVHQGLTQGRLLGLKEQWTEHR